MPEVIVFVCPDLVEEGPLILTGSFYEELASLSLIF